MTAINLPESLCGFRLPAMSDVILGEMRKVRPICVRRRIVLTIRNDGLIFLIVFHCFRSRVAIHVTEHDNREINCFLLGGGCSCCKE